MNNPSIPPSIGEGVVPVIQADRAQAWPHRPACYKDDPETQRRWLDGCYDRAAPVITDFARHRLAAIALTKEERVNIATVLAYESGVEDGSRTPPVPDNALREAPSINLAYSMGFSDARGLAAMYVWNHKGPLDHVALHEGIRAISGPSSEAEWDGVEMPFTLALEQIDGEAPAPEPRDGPTVGFPPSRDPEQDDGNDVVEEAFREGVLRGRWEAASIARQALAALKGSAS